MVVPNDQEREGTATPCSGQIQKCAVFASARNPYRCGRRNVGEECYWQVKWLLGWIKCINDKVKGEEWDQVVGWQWSEYTVEKGTEKRSSEQPVTKNGERELKHNPRGSQSVCCCCWAVSAPVIFTVFLYQSYPYFPKTMHSRRF